MELSRSNVPAYSMQDILDHASPTEGKIQQLAFDTYETAWMLGLSPKSIRRLNKSGKLRDCDALPGKKLYPLSEIQRFLSTFKGETLNG
jgi:hypothetical protein